MTSSNPNGYGTPSQLNTRDTNNRARQIHWDSSCIGQFQIFECSKINHQRFKGLQMDWFRWTGTTKIASIYLPSFVDDVLEFANLASFPVTGESGKMYVDLSQNKTYRWSGTVYVEISASPGSDRCRSRGASIYISHQQVLAQHWQDLQSVANSALSATEQFFRHLEKSRRK